MINKYYQVYLTVNWEDPQQLHFWKRAMLKFLWCTRREGKVCPKMGTQVSINAFSVCNWSGLYEWHCVVPSDIFGVVRECISGKVHSKILNRLPRRRLCVRMSYFGSPCPPPPPSWPRVSVLHPGLGNFANHCYEPTSERSLLVCHACALSV